MAVTWVGSCWFVGCGGVGEVKEVEKVEKLKEEVRGFCCVQPERRQGVIYIYICFFLRDAVPLALLTVDALNFGPP